MPAKRKIINDPVYGFIDMPEGINQSVVEHPWFQRLRHIRQLGLTFLVYPGALHTRFQHALGAHYLTRLAIQEIRDKGQEISKEEEEAVSAAILLHDIGHGPFSHALEHSIVSGINHEQISELMMERLNEEFKGKLTLALQIFRGKYKKTFLHQLVTSQLDMDRLDYLKRDSFFTGVSEGVVGSDRIIKMLNVVDDKLVVEAKGIYSIEKFLIARRLMYWQVYLHKTVLAAEQMLVRILKRAHELSNNGVHLVSGQVLSEFLGHQTIDFRKNPGWIDPYARLDDTDILAAVKEWSGHKDKVLSGLCSRLIERKLLKITMQKTRYTEAEVEEKKKLVAKRLKISLTEADYFVFTEKTTNHAYSIDNDRINILYKDGSLADISDASDMLNIDMLSKKVVKYYLCFPKD